MTKSNDSQSTYFLATTALEEFWDTSKSILFLGDWCKRYSRKSFWERLGGKVISHPWQNREKFREAYCYINAIYERLLPILAEALNEIHGVKHSERYWRIVIGPYLLHYIHILYDRYSLIRVALDNYDFTTIGLSEESFVIPLNTFDFVNSASDDLYNLQLYTRILTALGKSFPSRSLNITPHISAINGNKKIIKKYIKKFLNLINLAFQNNRQIILKSSYFNFYSILKLILKTNGKIWPDDEEDICLPALPLNWEKRKRLKVLSFGHNEFESIILDMLTLDIPQCYIEGFEIIKKEVEKKYPQNCMAIVSAVSWYWMEVFKQWAARSAEEGTLLIGIQHGGNYGSNIYLPCETYELSITDRFYSWGWDYGDSNSKVIPMPATKLMGRKVMGASNRKEDILFALTGTPRYLYRFQHLTNYEFNDYLLWQRRFADSISSDLKAKIRVRIYNTDYGWDYLQRWKDFYPDIRIEKWDVPFLKSLKNCRLYVCDHLSTTFLEALSADKPTILFWNPQIFELKFESQLYYDQLREVGILHETPESAASIINSVYYAVEEWWNESNRQAIRQKFCNRFARTSPNAINEWAKEFKCIANHLQKTKIP